MFERLRDAINAAIDAAMPEDDGREVVSGMRDAVIEARAGLEAMRQGLNETEQRLAVERKRLSDAERRGQMANKIGDNETVEIAEEYAAKHRERVAVLEDKLEAERAELGLAQRELEEMKSQLKKAVGSGAGRVDSAWREIEAAGGARPETDLNDDLLRSNMDRAAREAEAEARLEALKKKMGK